jgi:hypothetical protein
MYHVVHKSNLEIDAMTPFDKIGFLLFGAVFWLVGTIFYRARGAMIFETTSLRYWINFVLTPVFSAAVCLLLLKVRRVPAAEWAAASLLIALPGMFGEAVILSRFGAIMPGMELATGGKFAALLFVTYALFLAMAELVTLKATQ